MTTHVIQRLSTCNSQDIHRLINNPADLAFIKAWWRYGTTRTTEAQAYIERYSKPTGYSALGLASLTAALLGVKGRSWRFTLAAIKRAALPPSNLPGQLIKTADKSFGDGRGTSILATLTLIALITQGCSTTNLAEVIRAASKDPAAVTVDVRTIYGSLHFERHGSTNGPSGPGL